MPSNRIEIGSLVAFAQEAVGLVVVIDVFRAFTTAAIALANGAERIVMVDDLDTALALRKQGVGQYCMGERGGSRPPGFDFGNSPSEILNLRFDDETIIQTTSNGTRGIVAASLAKKIYAGSFVTAEATVQAIKESGEDEISLVAIGNGVDRADEDEVCALYLRSRILGLQPDHNALRTFIRTASKRIDGGTISPVDFECCLDIGKVPFAIRVVEDSGLWVASAESL